jgi:hypothetical protein
MWDLAVVDFLGQTSVPHAAVKSQLAEGRKGVVTCSVGEGRFAPAWGLFASGWAEHTTNKAQ